MIHNAEPGDIVWIANGYGPKAMVMEKLDRRIKKEPHLERGIYYRVAILEDKSIWFKETEVVHRAMSLSRVKRP